MICPVLAHNLLGTATSFALVEVLINVLELALSGYVASEQMSFARVRTAFDFVRARDAKSINHVLDEQGCWPEGVELHLIAAGRASGCRRISDILIF